MLPIPVPSHFRIIGHRGAAAYAPENTLPAFAVAQEMGVREVELDTQLATDGVVVLCHDTALERYGHGTNIVEEQSSQYLLELDMGSWFSPEFKGVSMTTLNQLCATFGTDFTYHIELKGAAENLARSVYNVVERAGLLQHSVFTSFSFDHLVQMRQISADCRLGWLVGADTFEDRILRPAEELQLFQLCPRADLVTEAMVQRGRFVVHEIRVWNLQGEAEHVRALIRRSVDAGCDGMTIDWPDWAAPEPRRGITTRR